MSVSSIALHRPALARYTHVRKNAPFSDWFCYLTHDEALRHSTDVVGERAYAAVDTFDAVIPTVAIPMMEDIRARVAYNEHKPFALSAYAFFRQRDGVFHVVNEQVARGITIGTRRLCFTVPLSPHEVTLLKLSGLA